MARPDEVPQKGWVEVYRENLKVDLHPSSRRPHEGSGPHSRPRTEYRKTPLRRGLQGDRAAPEASVKAIPLSLDKA